VVGGGGFLYVPATATSKVLFSTPFVEVGNFTGPTSTIGVTLFFSAVEVNGVAPAANSFRVSSHQINLTSGGSHVLTSSDFNSSTIVGADLTFSGTPITLHSTGGTIPYIVGWSVAVEWDTANTYA
jgi:hypothetical protein